MQDIHVGEKNLKCFKEVWGAEVITSVYSSESRGIAILFANDLDYEIVEVEEIECGNALVVQLYIGELKFHLCLLYGPNTDSPEFYINLKNRLLQKENIPIMICGDWNVVMDYNLDTQGYLKGKKYKSKKGNPKYD